MHARFLSRVPRKAVAALALFTLLCVTGCAAQGSAQAGGTVHLRYYYWGNTARAALTDQAIAVFEKEHPNIVIDSSWSPYGNYRQKLTTEAAGGDPPDVFQMDFPFMRSLSDRGVLKDLTPYQGNVLDTSHLYPQLRGTGEVGGKYFAVPEARNTMGIVYDVQAWQKAVGGPPRSSWTWAQFIRAAAKVSASTHGKEWGVTDLAYYNVAFEMWLMQRGKLLYTPSGQLGFTPQDLRAFWNMLTQMRRMNASDTPEATFDANPASPLGAGKTAAEFDWDNTSTADASTNTKQLALAPPPSGDTGRTGLYMKPGIMMSVSSRTPHAKEAAMFISFLINDPKAGQIFGANRGLPATTTQEKAVRLTGLDKQVDDYENRVLPTMQPGPPAPPAGSAPLVRTSNVLAEKVSYGQISVDAAVNDYFNQAKVDLR